MACGISAFVYVEATMVSCRELKTRNNKRRRLLFQIKIIRSTHAIFLENRLVNVVKGTSGVQGGISGGEGAYAYQYDYRTRRIVRDDLRATRAALKELKRKAALLRRPTPKRERAALASVLLVTAVRASGHREHRRRAIVNTGVAAS